MHRLGVVFIAVATLVSAVSCSTYSSTDDSSLAVSQAAVGVGWQSTAPMDERRQFHAGVVLQSGKALVTGGWGYNRFLATSELYAPITGTWSYTAGALTRPREAHSRKRRVQ